MCWVLKSPSGRVNKTISLGERKLAPQAVADGGKKLDNGRHFENILSFFFETRIPLEFQMIQVGSSAIGNNSYLNILAILCINQMKYIAVLEIHKFYNLSLKLKV